MKETVQYAVWQEPCDESEEGMWCFYDTIDDAASSSDHPVEIFRFTGRLIGTFKRATKVFRVKKRKTKKKEKK